MESIKPSFDVILQTGIHRGLHSRYFRKRRPHPSKSSHEESDRPSRRGHDRGLSAGKDDAEESRDWHLRPSTVYGDRDKRKTYYAEKDRRAQPITDFRDLSPVRNKTADVAGSRRGVKEKDTGSSLSAMVMRASRLSTADLDDASSSWSTRSATLPRSIHYYPGAAVISVDELPRPQRGTYHVETDDTRSWSTGGGAYRASAGGVRPVSMHEGELMSYLHVTESTPNDFTLDALMASQRQHEPQQNVYTDDDIGQLNRFLDNPFAGHNYERKHQVRSFRGSLMTVISIYVVDMSSVHGTLILLFFSSLFLIVS